MKKKGTTTLQIANWNAPLVPRTGLLPAGFPGRVAYSLSTYIIWGYRKLSF